MATKISKQTIKKRVKDSEKSEKKISQFGKMRGSYKGKIVEHGNVWDL
ncbi:MAG: hypothetical protein LBN37_02310 [Bacteroidales bacterium]|jgi:hypothetical protein|nr:hypothetical protein [Bacteroidales bacterium]